MNSGELKLTRLNLKLFSFMIKKCIIVESCELLIFKIKNMNLQYTGQSRRLALSMNGRTSRVHRVGIEALYTGTAFLRCVMCT